MFYTVHACHKGVDVVGGFYDEHPVDGRCTKDATHQVDSLDGRIGGKGIGCGYAFVSLYSLQEVLVHDFNVYFLRKFTDLFSNMQ